MASFFGKYWKESGDVGKVCLTNGTTNTDVGLFAHVFLGRILIGWPISYSAPTKGKQSVLCG